MSNDTFTGEKDTFHQTKETISKMHQPLKISAKAYHGKESGHMIEVSMNLAWDEIDSMFTDKSEIVAMISNMIKLIEGPLKSKYLGMIDEKN